MVRKITNRQIRCSTVLTALFLGAVFVSPRFVFSQATLPPFDISLPFGAADFSDLDVRDEMNRPLQKLAVVRDVQRIVTASLNELILNNLTPMQRHVRETLSKSADVVAAWFGAAATKAISKLQGWLQERRKTKFLVSNRRRADLTNPSPWHESILQHRTSFLFQISSLLSSTQLLR